jgi:preprotein translocase subunit SecA
MGKSRPDLMGVKMAGLGTPCQELLETVNRYAFADLSDEKLRELLSVGESPTSLPLVYAIVKEMIRRVTGLTLFDTQLAAAYAMQQGFVAELPTGEGKTLSAVVTAAAFAVQGQKVHVLVFNDYLARRDHAANEPIYELCGLTCGVIDAQSTPEERKRAYACDVLYASAREVGFDQLRDFLCTDPASLLVRSFPVALVDEADSILIDEARVPLVLAGNREDTAEAAERIGQIVSGLGTEDVSVQLQDNQVWLTDSGIERVQEALGMSNLYEQAQSECLPLLHAALEARFLVHRDREYLVRDNRVYLIDESTGRVAAGRKFPNLLQQAVEIREQVPGEARTVIHNSLTMQAFLRQYRLLCGMTGTAASSAKAFGQLYALKVAVIPPHVPCIRVDLEDAVFPDAVAQQAALLACVRSAHEAGRPVLIGTRSVEESEALSEAIHRQGLPHVVLNARHDEQEAAIIAETGRPCRITVSTNMAGRGVDIRLGGSDLSDAAAVRAAGGLLVLGTGMNRSLRVDNQLRGRAGRQGDPGESRFFVNLEDVLGALDAEQHASNRILPGKSAGMPAPRDAERLMRDPARLRRVQRLLEGRDAEARYMLERYSEILEEKRQTITAYREELLLGKRTPGILVAQNPDAFHRLEARHGEPAVQRAEQQLTLFFINRHWSDYLSAMEDKRNGIHLEVVAGGNPLEAYRRFAVPAFAEMQEDIRRDVLAWMQRCRITEDGIDMAGEGLVGATSTWTYQINDAADQFSRIPHLVRTMSHAIRGTLFSVRSVFTARRKRF